MKMSCCTPAFTIGDIFYPFKQKPDGKYLYNKTTGLISGSFQTAGSELCTASALVSIFKMSTFSLVKYMSRSVVTNIPYILHWWTIC